MEEDTGIWRTAVRFPQRPFLKHSSEGILVLSDLEGFEKVDWDCSLTTVVQTAGAWAAVSRREK